MSQLAWRCFEGARPQRTAQIQVLADLWVPAFAGMAEEARVEIAALLVDSNWITASKAGTQVCRGHRLEPVLGPAGGRCDKIFDAGQWSPSRIESSEWI